MNPEQLAQDATTHADTVYALLEEIASALAEMATEDQVVAPGLTVDRVWSTEMARAEYRATITLRVHDLDPMTLLFDLQTPLRVGAVYGHLTDDDDAVIVGQAERTEAEPALPVIDRAIQDLYERASLEDERLGV